MLVISNHSPDYSLNCTPLSPITITYSSVKMSIMMTKEGVMTKVNTSLADQAVVAFLPADLLGNNHHCMSNNHYTKHDVKISFVKLNVVLCTL